MPRSFLIRKNSLFCGCRNLPAGAELLHRGHMEEEEDTMSIARPVPKSIPELPGALVFTDLRSFPPLFSANVLPPNISGMPISRDSAFTPIPRKRSAIPLFLEQCQACAPRSPLLSLPVPLLPPRCDQALSGLSRQFAEPPFFSFDLYAGCYPQENPRVVDGCEFEAGRTFLSQNNIASLLGVVGSEKPRRGQHQHAPPRYQCEACKKSYATFGGLSKHRQFHCSTQAKKDFSCKFCTKSYASLGALKMHIRTHTLPCRCKLCGKAFSRPWLLQGHIRTHTGEKPFRCPHCGRAFADRSNLRAHLQTHSDVKKYGCKRCSKTFSRMSLLLKHEDSSCPGLRR